MKKKILALALCVAMLAISVVSGTLAYFTDVDDETNVFTVGSVDITLVESYVHRENAYAIDGSAQKTMSDAEILAGSDYEGSTVYDEYVAGIQLMPGTAINKMPYVKNEGMSDAWVRIRVMIPTKADTDHLMSSVVCTTALNEEFDRPAGVGDYAPDSTKTVGGIEYNVYTFIRETPLEAGKMTNWNVWNTIRMDEDVTSADLAQMKADGIITADGKLNVIVEADAIQAANLATYQAAWDAFDNQ